MSRRNLLVTYDDTNNHFVLITCDSYKESFPDLRIIRPGDMIEYHHVRGLSGTIASESDFMNLFLYDGGKVEEFETQKEAALKFLEMIGKRKMIETFFENYADEGLKSTKSRMLILYYILNVASK
jgi:hypothetical protein